MLILKISFRLKSFIHSQIQISRCRITSTASLNPTFLQNWPSQIIWFMIIKNLAIRERLRALRVWFMMIRCNHGLWSVRVILFYVSFWWMAAVWRHLRLSYVIAVGGFWVLCADKIDKSVMGRAVAELCKQFFWWALLTARLIY